MVSRYAVVGATNVVETVVIWDGIAPFSPCHETDRVVHCDPTVSAGWTYSAGLADAAETFTAPAEEF